MLLVLAPLLLAGCENDFPPSEVPLVPKVEVDPSFYEPTLDPDYIISPGDALLINSYYEPSLKQPVVVQPDGRVSLLLVGEVMAAGKSPGQLRQELTKSYNKYLRSTDVAVGVTEVANEAIYVGGEVHQPRVESARGHITLLQAIAGAGGFTTAANREQVLILRAGADGHFRALQQNVEAELHNEAGEIYLRRHDIVYVPKTQIAKVDQFIDQYVNQIIPRSTSMIFGYQFINQLNGSSSVIVPP